MPECHRCTRTFSSGEVRRTAKGHVCKDAIACERRKRSLVVDVELRAALDAIEEAYEELDRGYGSRDVLVALTKASKMLDALNAVVYATVMSAARTTPYTQKELAQALGIPTSALRGLKEAAREKSTARESRLERMVIESANEVGARSPRSFSLRSRDGPAQGEPVTVNPKAA